MKYLERLTFTNAQLHTITVQHSRFRIFLHLLRFNISSTNSKGISYTTYIFNHVISFGYPISRKWVRRFCFEFGFLACLFTWEVLVVIALVVSHSLFYRRSRFPHTQGDLLRDCLLFSVRTLALYQKVIILLSQFLIPF